MNETIMMAVAIVGTCLGIGAAIVLVVLGLTLIRKKWPDVWD